MSATIQKQGDYELFETTHQHKILVLNGEEWFAWVSGQESPLLVKSDSDHQKDRTLSKGNFFLMDFEDEPDFKDMPHLFLQLDDRYQEVVLPNGLPTDQDHQKRLVETDETVQEDKLRQFVRR